MGFAEECETLFVPAAMLDDDINILQQVDVAQDIAAHCNDVVSAKSRQTGLLRGSSGGD
jgi:hypothetical protein